MARKPTKSKSVAVPSWSEDLPEEVLDAVAQVESMDDASAGKSMSKSAAARAAIDAGYVTPAQAVAYIQRQYGVTMGAQHFSAVKSQYKQQQEAFSASGKKGGSAGKPQTSSNLKKGTSSAHGEGGLLEALEGVKELVGQYGADQVKRMVDLLG